MCATHTQDVDATVEQAEAIRGAGGGLVRVAVDSPKDVEALAPRSAARRSANLVVDLQENYRLAAAVAPHVDKVRYNPGHLWHHERTKPVSEKVRFLVDVARDHDLRAPHRRQLRQRRPGDEGALPARTTSRPWSQSALEHCRYMDDFGFERYVVSLKDSHPRNVIEANRRFAELRPTCRCTWA